ncbi:putative spore coat regulator YlbO domain protein [Anoxybacillus sp. B7M1]|uniref:hypothetical protein n=1 Tax=unclassified Anoxybacillus TaxID=2639704 RepID=UPI0006984E77|nr:MULTISPECIES: hypothetical protein [unclassified Anoxybacillus]ANB56287.1 putative spore coat regulator YlbO domain protein [Anoxybacillus sp. B2M1]ANB62528.1 putative spore coat regulator YlbO domain protein [Anoxybacillus sp. B7M1]
MNSKPQEDVMVLKQKMADLQSKLAQYEAQRNDSNALKLENKRLTEELERAEAKVRELTKQIEEVVAENIILKELAWQSEKRYEELTKLQQEKEELERRLAQFKIHFPTEEGENWFFHTLRQQNAIIKRKEKNDSPPSSAPFSFSEGTEEK